MVKAQMERITEQLGGKDVDDNSDQMYFKPDDNDDTVIMTGDHLQQIWRRLPVLRAADEQHAVVTLTAPGW